MVRRMKIKWVAPILLTGTLLAGGSAAIAAATSVESGEISEAEAAEIRAKMAERKRGAKEGDRPFRAEIEARIADMQKKLAAKVESGEISEAEAAEIRSKMAERKGKFDSRLNGSN